MSKHQYVPLWMLKEHLTEDFIAWCVETPMASQFSIKDYTEWLIQNGFLQGKKWLDYIDTIQYTLREMLDGKHIHCLLTEGFIPQDAMIGPKGDK